MVELSDRQIAEYWHRSHRTVDGLWFMKIEEKYGFDVALDIDNEVWKVFPKIQARMIKSMGDLENGIGGLFEAVKTKLSLEGFEFEAEKMSDGSGFKIVVSECPWHNIMVTAGREELSGRVGTLICFSENSVWASEFGNDICFSFSDQICEGCETCVLKFSNTPDDTL
jgi:hypothetical protein